MRAAIYLRISLDRTGQELGVDRQREDCLALAARRGDDVVHTFTDNDRSAKNEGKRPGYAELIAAVRAGAIDRIYVWSQGRLWRNRTERAAGFEILRAARVSLVQVKGPEVDMSTAMGRMIAGIIGEFDTGENEIKAERQERETLQRAQRGLPPVGGRRAFGFDSSGLKQVRAEAAAVKRAYADLLAGGTLSGIAAGLNARGLLTTRGGPWRHNAVRGMLLNPRNAGLRTLNGEEVGKGVWRPIVTEDVFRAAVAILREPERRTNRRGNALVHLGSGLYLCGRCTAGVPVICTYRGAKDRGDQRRVYRCPECYLTRKADPIDEWVQLVMVERLRRPDLAELVAAPAVDISPLRTEAQALRGRLEMLADNLDIDERDLARRSRRIRERLDEVQQQMSALARGSAIGELLRAPDPGQAWLDFRDVGRRQAVVRDLVTIRLLPTGTGRRVFDRASVAFTWPGQTSSV